MKLNDLTIKIRSKNSGPFLLTIDIFFSNKKKFCKGVDKLTKEKISILYKIPQKEINIYSIKELNIIKITFPRPNIQGSYLDRDLHGASFGYILEELTI